MKRLVFVLALILVLINKSFAQGFEGAQMSPAFSKAMDSVENVSLVGKSFTRSDFAISETIHIKALTKAEGIKYALTLIRDPKDLGLLKYDGINIIRTTEGDIIIHYSSKLNLWVLNFFHSTIKANDSKRVRAFTLK